MVVVVLCVAATFAQGDEGELNAVVAKREKQEPYPAFDT